MGEGVNHWEDCSAELERLKAIKQKDSEPPIEHVADKVPANLFPQGREPMDPDEFAEMLSNESLASATEARTERIKNRIKTTLHGIYGTDAVSLSTYSTSTEAQQKVLLSCRRFVDSFEDRKQDGKGMVFYGSPGTGKTHLACSIAKELILRGHNVVYESMLTMMRQIKSTYSPSSVLTEEVVLKRFTSPDLLILDEVGKQFNSDTEKLKTFEIIDHRYSRNLPFILISNHNQKKLADGLTASVWDRVVERCLIFGFTWESYRRLKR